MNRIEITYPIQTAHTQVYIGAAAFDHLETYLSTQNFSKIILLGDSNTMECCLPLIDAKYAFLLDAEIIEIEPLEESKSMETLQFIWQSFLEMEVQKDALLINIGGGMVSDVGAFAASAYKRGIAYINIPTSFLSMVDACIGGKNGINFSGIKNQIGNFYAPIAVYIYPDFLNTLPERAYISAAAEIIKYGLIYEASFFEEIEQESIHEDNIEVLITKCIGIKKHFIEMDPLDVGERKKLNFGHTIGHALEAYFEGTETPLLHGEAVAIGILCEAYLSNKNSTLSFSSLTRIKELIFTYFPKQTLLVSAEKIMPFLHADKKNYGNEIKGVLIKEIGLSIIDQKFDIQDVIESIEYYNSL